MHAGITERLLEYGYLFVFLGTIFEGDATLLTASFLSHRGHLNLALVLLTAALSTTACNQVYFYLARRHAQTLLDNSSGRSRLIAKARASVEKRGAFLLFISRFLFGLRTAIPAACGATGMPATRFFWINVAGAAVWVGVFGLIGYAGGSLLSTLWRDIRHHEWQIAFWTGITAFLIAGWRSRGRDIREMTIAFSHPSHLAEEAFEDISLFAQARIGIRKLFGRPLESPTS
jgi:membrane protein DedA with SNARE-associated domain